MFVSALRGRDVGRGPRRDWCRGPFWVGDGWGTALIEDIRCEKIRVNGCVGSSDCGSCVSGHKQALQIMHRDPRRCSPDRNSPRHSMLFGLSSLARKIFHSARRAYHRYNLARPTRVRGVSRSSRTRDGMRWTRQRRACDVIAGRLSVSDHSPRKTNGADAYCKTVWSRHPLLVPSCRWQIDSYRRRSAIKPAVTVTRRIRRRGEQGISRKTIAQGMPDCLR